MVSFTTVYTSISISDKRYQKFKACALEIGENETKLLSVLCYKVGKYTSKKIRYFRTTEYQNHGDEYRIRPVKFFVTDHEYMHSNRLARKISVSKLIALAIDLFIDEIMENGINPIEIAHLRIIENSYKKKSYYIRNLTFKITKKNQFDEYMMKMRMEKT